MKMRAAWWLMLAGCAPSPLVLEGAEDVDFLAVLELDASGKVSALSGLEAWSPSGSLTYVLAEENALVLGFSREELERAGAPVEDARVLRETLLELNTSCAERVPRPVYARRMSGDLLGAELVGEVLLGADPSGDDPGGEIPSLTARWAEDRCPSIDEDAFSFEVDCVSFRCGGVVRKSGACRFEADLECELGQVSLAIDADGAACVDSNTGNTRADCTIVPHVAPAEPSFALSSTLLFDVEPYVPPLSLTGGTVQMPRAGRYLGYAYDLAVLEEEVVLALGPGAPVEICLPPGVGGGSLAFVDQESLEVVRTATVPSCTTLLGVDRGQLYAVHHDGEAIVLSELDRLGGIERSVVLDGLRASCDRPISLDFAGEELVLVSDGTAYPDRCGAHGSDVVILGRNSLRVRDVYNYREVSAYATALRDDSTLVLGDSLEVRTLFVDLSDGTVTSTVIVPREIARNDIVIPDLFLIQRTGELLLSLGRNSVNTLLVDETRGVLGSTFFYAVNAGPSAVGATLNGELLITGTARRDPESWPAYAARMTENAGGVRIEPEAARIGHGAVRRIAADARGRLWMLLPWEARLVRLGL